MPAATPDIELTPDEQSLFNVITFEQSELDHPKSLRNGEMVAVLMQRLTARQAIPTVRLEYFDNPDYREGRPKGSHRYLFHRNGRTDEEILEHPNFLKYAQYFLCGPDLPTEVLAKFRGEVARFGHVGPSDALELGELARKLTRRQGLVPHEACEEFYKLSLDCGIWLSHALRIRERVRTLRVKP